MALGMLEGCRCSDSGVQVLGWFASFDAPWSKHCFAEACRGCTPQAGEVGVEQQAMFAIRKTEKNKRALVSRHLTHACASHFEPGRCPTLAPTPTFFCSKALTEPKRCPLTILGYGLASPRSKRAKERTTGHA